MAAYPQKNLADENNEFNQLSFIIAQALAKLSAATLVKVKAVHPGAGLLVGFVDLTPLVNQVDGSGAAMPHATIYGVPYFRVQGGANAVICDPVAGDIGFALFADRDISSVKATGAAASPASARRFDMADALYFGGWNLSTPPTSYVQVTAAAINIVQGGSTSAVLTPGLLTVNANLKVNGTAEITGDTKLDSTVEVGGLASLNASMVVTGTATGASGTFNLTGSLTASGEIQGNGKKLSIHTHSGVTTGGGSTGAPN